MTFKEALDSLRYEVDEEGHCSYIEDELHVAMEALERQVPKKPTHEASIYKCCTCPNCKNVVDEFIEFVPIQPKVRVTTDYCKFCGQALDWSDTDDR